MTFVAPRIAWDASGPRSGRGSTAVEFAVLFPLFFIIFYAIVTFSLIFVAQQNLTFAAEEGARVALNFLPASDLPDALKKRKEAACTAALSVSGWLADASSCDATPNPCAYDASMQCITVTLAYHYSTRPLVPPLPLLDVALPTQLTGTAVIQLNPGYLL